MTASGGDPGGGATPDFPATLAIGLTGVADYSPEVPFLDLMKMSRPFFGDFGSQNHDYLRANGHLDAQGWPLTMPPSGKVETVWAMPGVSAPYWSNKQLRLRWAGTGNITMPFGGVELSRGTRSVLFRLNDFSANALDRSDIMWGLSCNGPVQNITLVPEAHVAAFDAGAKWNPDFISFNG